MPAAAIPDPTAYAPTDNNQMIIEWSSDDHLLING